MSRSSEPPTNTLITKWFWFASTETTGLVKFLDFFVCVIFALCTYGKSSSNHHIIKDSIFGTFSKHHGQANLRICLVCGASMPLYHSCFIGLDQQVSKFYFGERYSSPNGPWWSKSVSSIWVGGVSHPCMEKLHPPEKKKKTKKN